MKKMNIKILLLGCLFSIMSILVPHNIEAAGNFSISKGSATLTTGETATITVSASNCAGQFTITSSNSSVATVSTTSIWLDNSSVPITITAKGAGTATITIKATDVTDTDLNTVSGARTCSITVSNPAPVTPTNPPSNNNNGSTNNNGGSNSSSNNSGSSNKPPVTPTKPEEPKSNDSTLKGLAIEGYELYPVFDANTREYNLRVTNDITKVTVTPTVNHSKASYKIEGSTEELLVGKNVITVVVTAEDGTTSNYVINVTREREGLNVQYIKIYYTDEAGNRQELLLNPEFSTEIFEYTLNDLSYLISKLDVEVLANLEQAEIEITGNEELVEGENTIVITVTMSSESEEEEDEVLKYKITVKKEKEPVVTLMGRIKNWFNGITGTVSTWFGENQYNVIMGALIICVVSLIGLSIYIVIDYKKYRLIVEKIAEITRINNATITKANESVNTQEQVIENKENDSEENKRGRHF